MCCYIPTTASKSMKIYTAVTSGHIKSSLNGAAVVVGSILVGELYRMRGYSQGYTHGELGVAAHRAPF